MRADLPGPLAETLAGARAEAVIRACVHCGMCNAVCPTFQLTGDELDGPRGRIYLMKGALEGEAFGSETLTHLDRCLECRACESACPSGVEYHRLLDVGRPFVEARVSRPWRERALRWLIREVASDGRRFALALALGRAFAPLLPGALRRKLPPLFPQRGKQPEGPKGISADASDPLTGFAGAPPSGEQRRMSLLAGCVQAGAAPHFNAAAKRVFAHVGVRLDEAPRAGCCGALAAHLGSPEEARRLARRNIDAWLAEADAGAEGLVVTASGCAAFLKDYPDLLADDLAYAEKARRLAALVRDPIEVLGAASPEAMRAPQTPRVAVHDPCTLRNALKLGGRVEALLRRLGYEPQPVRDAHLCCGSAGHYSLTQPAFAGALREAKLDALCEGGPDVICTANIGCWMHLSETSPTPLRHWLELVDDVV